MPHTTSRFDEIPYPGREMTAWFSKVSLVVHFIGRSYRLKGKISLQNDVKAKKNAEGELDKN